MDQKKDLEVLAAVKTGAEDNGKRIDLSGVDARTTVRRRASESARTPQPAASEHREVVVPQSMPAVLMPAPETIEFDDSGDFAAMLAESDTRSTSKNLNLNPGDKVSGRLVHIGQDFSFIALDAKLEAAIASAELKDQEGNLKVAVGDQVSGFVISTHGGVTISNQASQSGLDEAMLNDALIKRMPVEGKISGVNKGGFDVIIGGKRAFCPVGQIDIKFVEDTSVFIGRVLPFLVQRIEEGGRNIVLSRRALLESERREQALEKIKSLEVGKIYEAVISRVSDFGAFADIGGLEGLIPRSEISHGRIERVSDVVSSNDRVQVAVLSFEINQAEPSKSRLSLSLKKTKDDPYDLHWSKIVVGNTMEGRVVRLENFGAFVELFPGIDGLIHISELSENRITHPKEILSVGDPVSVRVVSVNNEEKRIGLSLRETPVRKKSADDVSLSIKVERGQKFSGVVSRIERYGIFIELPNSATALLPQSETGLPKNADLSRAFKIGETIEVAVIDVDAQNRIRVSSLARKAMDERDSYLQFQGQENQRAGSFGTFASLLKKR